MSGALARQRFRGSARECWISSNSQPCATLADSADLASNGHSCTGRARRCSSSRAVPRSERVGGLVDLTLPLGARVEEPCQVALSVEIAGAHQREHLGAISGLVRQLEGLGESGVLALNIR